MENTRPITAEVETTCEWCDSVITWTLPKRNQFGDLERENKKCIGCGQIHSNAILFERFKDQIELHNEPVYIVSCPYCQTKEGLKLSPKQACGNLDRAAAKCKDCGAIFNTFYNRTENTMTTSKTV